MKYKNDKILSSLSEIQKKVLCLYDIVVTDEMLTKKYNQSLEKKINNCTNFEKAKELRTEVFAIENYRSQRNEEIFGISNDGEFITDENGDVNYEFYDFLNQITSDNEPKKENKPSQKHI